MKIDMEYIKAKLNVALLISGKQSVVNGEGGLTRTELRALERAGVVEKLRTETRKWKDITGTIQYSYRKVKHDQTTPHPTHPSQ
jgi:hypothetical protein